MKLSIIYAVLFVVFAVFAVGSEAFIIKKTMAVTVMAVVTVAVPAIVGAVVTMAAK